MERCRHVLAGGVLKRQRTGDRAGQIDLARQLERVDRMNVPVSVVAFSQDDSITLTKFIARKVQMASLTL
jgi:hypothetical protein